MPRRVTCTAGDMPTSYHNFNRFLRAMPERNRTSGCVRLTDFRMSGAYSWRAAKIGRAASPREAQYWHHHWRPGFTDRLTRDWIHAGCLDGDHRATGADPRTDRFTTHASEPHGDHRTGSATDDESVIQPGAQLACPVELVVLAGSQAFARLK